MRTRHGPLKAAARGPGQSRHLPCPTSPASGLSIKV